ncbi:leucyl aminopeptidase [Kordiimonas sp.]|uniref:leucyl aminopeptidase n=1 Tax=Kordiimonas sp. TaxID=1970157 RepID=UPI003A8F8D6F
MKIQFTEKGPSQKGVRVYPLFEGGAVPPDHSDLGDETRTQLKRALALKEFTGKAGQLVTLLTPAGSGLDTLIVMGLGHKDEATAYSLEEAGGKLACHLQSLKEKDVTLCLPQPDGTVSFQEEELAAHLACGMKLRNYRFDRYKTDEAGETPPLLRSVTIDCRDQQAAAQRFAKLDAAIRGNHLARDLVSEPSNILYPESYATRIEALTALGLEVEILGEEEMQALGMNALLAVGQGSARKSQLVVMRWHGAADREMAPLAFVGKGVTFDTGGISLKPHQNMQDMKFDMGGSAAVVGLMQCLATRKAPVNAVGVVGLVENMPSSTATRPGDVVKSLSGKTIEIVNTDAEGRLVLADALYYTQTTYKPQAMINLATLTGAIVGALAHEHAGLFSNDDDLSLSLIEAGELVGETLWRLPMGKAYAKMIKSDIADLSNLGAPGAGSITAAQFLENFVGDTRWAHLDIAGTVWLKEGSDLSEKGATGYGVRLLDQWVKAVELQAAGEGI